MKLFVLVLSTLFLQPSYANPDDSTPVSVIDCVEAVLREAGFSRLALEVELKYSLSRADSTRLRAIVQGESNVSHFQTYYFDTPDRRLRALDLNLRLRLRNNEGDQIACLKAKPGIRIRKKGLPRKRRWEAEVDMTEEVASQLIAGSASWTSIAPIKHGLLEFGLEEQDIMELKSFGFVETSRTAVEVQDYPAFLFDKFTLNGVGEEYFELEVEAEFDEMLRSHAFVLSLMAFHGVEYSPELHSKRTRLLDAPRLP